MNLQQARDTIESYFKMSWTSKTPVETANESYKPVTGTAWVRLSVMESNARNAEVGTTGSHVRKRHTGRVYVEVFRPAYRKDELASLVSDAEKVLQFKTLAQEITLDASSTQTIGVISGGAWYLEICSTPFRFDEIIIDGN